MPGEATNNERKYESMGVWEYGSMGVWEYGSGFKF